MLKTFISKMNCEIIVKIIIKFSNVRRPVRTVVVTHHNFKIWLFYECFTTEWKSDEDQKSVFIVCVKWRNCFHPPPSHTHFDPLRPLYSLRLYWWWNPICTHPIIATLWLILGFKNHNYIGIFIERGCYKRNYPFCFTLCIIQFVFFFCIRHLFRFI